MSYHSELDSEQAIEFYDPEEYEMMQDAIKDLFCISIHTSGVMFFYRRSSSEARQVIRPTQSTRNRLARLLKRSSNSRPGADHVRAYYVYDRNLS